MGIPRPDNWLKAITDYRYPVDLTKLPGIKPPWPTPNLSVGDRKATASFEDHFRQYAVMHIEAWLEVLYWKLFSQPHVRDKTTTKVAEYFREQRVEAGKLCDVCSS